MLKFVIIGILIMGFLSFVLWNLWKMTLLKRKYFSRSANLFHTINQFEDVPSQLESIKKAKIKTLLLAIAGSISAVLLVLTYFLVARNIFISNHIHSYKKRVIEKPTCLAEGRAEYNCRYCDENYEEVVPVTDHNYVKSSQLDATCILPGKTVYTCDMCADTMTETIPLKEHKFVQSVARQASCTNEGLLANQCENCHLLEYVNIPTNGAHIFRIQSFVPPSFLHTGYHHYSCQDCGYEVYSLSVEPFNWVTALAIIIFLFSIFAIIFVRVSKRFWRHTFRSPLFWFSVISTILSITVMVLYWGFIVPRQNSNKPIFQNFTRAPIECELVELEREESSYTENGTVFYKCSQCDQEYTEYLPLKEPDIDQIPVYTEPVIAHCNETEKNGRISRANELPMHTSMTGNLASQKDTDCYMVTLPRDGSITFKFTHEADAYSYHWEATIYDTDKSTVLNEGYIDKEEFGCSDLPAGTYYIKISVISGGNPIMNTFSDADYHLTFIPECTEHAETTDYFTKTPQDSAPLEIITVCNHCSAVVSVVSLG